MTFKNIAARKPSRAAASGRRYARGVIGAVEGGWATGRTRVVAVVVLAAVAAVAATIGIVLLQTRGESTTAPGAVTKARAGAPPLWLDFGVRTDSEARALAGAQTLYNRGDRAAAAAVFARYHSVDAQIGSAFADWPHGSLDAMKHLVATNPGNGAALLHLGWAYYWSGRNEDAVTTWQRVAKTFADSPAGVDAQTALHPAMAPGLPIIVASVAPPAAVAALPAGQELRALARAAAKPDANAKLLYGIALWNLRRPVSAERQLEAAAALAPHDPAVLTAAAVGAFTKSDPVRAFSRLGPLTGVFPRAAVVRLHLGLVLIWTGQIQKGERQLRLAVADGPKTVYGQQANLLIRRLSKNGTK
jgi:tetratricopeptide (TPR) repeat protein